MKNLLFLALFSFMLIAGENNHYMQTRGEKISSQLTAAGSVLFGGLDVRGYSLRSLFKRTYTSWPKMERLIREAVANDNCIVISDCGEDYIDDFAQMTNSQISDASEIQLLIDGPVSFKKRNELIRSAKKSIKFITWAIYDDETGLEFKNLILDQLKKEKELKVKIIVDGQVAKRDHHFGVIEELEEKAEGRVEVLRWRAKRYRANGNHRKMLMVDDTHLVAGGMNIGDVYSHLAGDDFWRDTDIYLKGNVAKSAVEIFNNVWNEQVENNRKESDKEKINQELQQNLAAENIPVVIVDHNPGTKNKKADMNITTAMVKLIDEAEVSIDIENAYLILTSPVLYALKDAVARGVKVRILTNSAQSVDEPVVAVPIQKSVEIAHDFGASMYLRKGTTLHSKFMIVDQKITMIGSFNLHPRSHRYEGENMITIFDQGVAFDLQRVFENDISELNATKVENKTDIEYEDNFLAKIARTLFFDQL
jgi:cardiolipin synthase